MNSLENYRIIKQSVLSSQRPSYPVPQLISGRDAQRLKNARTELKKTFDKEMQKPPAQRNQQLVYDVSCELYPRLCGQ